jgi:hypothetical protein
MYVECYACRLINQQMHLHQWRNSAARIGSSIIIIIIIINLLIIIIIIIIIIAYRPIVIVMVREIEELPGFCEPEALDQERVNRPRTLDRAASHARKNKYICHKLVGMNRGFQSLAHVVLRLPLSVCVCLCLSVSVLVCPLRFRLRMSRRAQFFHRSCRSNDSADRDGFCSCGKMVVQADRMCARLNSHTSMLHFGAWKLMTAENSAIFLCICEQLARPWRLLHTLYPKDEGPCAVVNMHTCE